jgi:uncharacterized membrane protein
MPVPELQKPSDLYDYIERREREKARQRLLYRGIPALLAAAYFIFLLAKWNDIHDIARVGIIIGTALFVSNALFLVFAAKEENHNVRNMVGSGAFVAACLSIGLMVGNAPPEERISIKRKAYVELFGR